VQVKPETERARSMLMMRWAFIRVPLLRNKGGGDPDHDGPTPDKHINSDEDGGLLDHQALISQPPFNTRIASPFTTGNLMLLILHVRRGFSGVNHFHLTAPARNPEDVSVLIRLGEEALRSWRDSCP
jgi:hypothetical protein